MHRKVFDLVKILDWFEIVGALICLSSKMLQIMVDFVCFRVCRL